MIPGNRPEDQEWEEACDRILDMVLDSGLDPQTAKKAVEIGIRMVLKGFEP